MASLASVLAGVMGGGGVSPPVVQPAGVTPLPSPFEDRATAFRNFLASRGYSGTAATNHYFYDQANALRARLGLPPLVSPVGYAWDPASMAHGGVSLSGVLGALAGGMPTGLPGSVWSGVPDNPPGTGVTPAAPAYGGAPLPVTPVAPVAATPAAPVPVASGARMQNPAAPAPYPIVAVPAPVVGGTGAQHDPEARVNEGPPLPPPPLFTPYVKPAPLFAQTVLPGVLHHR